MSAIVNDIFRLTSSGHSARATLKANMIFSVQSNPITPAKGDEMDKVTLSKLAQSLKGVENLDGGKRPLSSLLKDETGKLFNSLNKQDQDLLQSLFDQGSASAKDIELGLQSLANTVISTRANLERPHSADEVAAKKEYTELNNLSHEYNDAISTASEIEMEASRQFHFGKINEEQLNSLKEESQKQIKEINESEKYKNIHERAAQAAEKWQNLDSSASKEFLGGSIVTPEQETARKKLSQLGFGDASVLRALQTYAYQRDSLAVIR